MILSQNPTGMFHDDIRSIQVQSRSGTVKHGSWMIFVGVTYSDKVPCDRLTNPEFLSRVWLQSSVMNIYFSSTEPES